MTSWTVLFLSSPRSEVGALVRQFLGGVRGALRVRSWVVRKVFLRSGIVSDMVLYVLTGYQALDTNIKMVGENARRVELERSTVS